MTEPMMPEYDELVAELITLRAVIDARKYVRIARAADDAIDRALSGTPGGAQSETKYDGKRIRYGTARAGDSHGAATSRR
jgi:hypothetical protein